MVKKILISVGSLLLLADGGLFFYLDSIVKSGIEVVGSSVLGAAVTGTAITITTKRVGQHLWPATCESRGFRIAICF
jgi:hypothetical protein